jgi:phytoene synthase
MSALDYCRDKVALPGSSLYYSVLFVPPRLREALVALHAAAEEFREITDEVGDEGVARAKLGWWAEEMQRTAAGEPRHPVTQLLARPMREAGVDAVRFVGVLNALVEHHRRQHYRTMAELESHAQRLADLTGCMAAELCGFDNPATLEASAHLGVGLTLTEIARRPRRAAGRRETDLPADLLAQCGASQADLHATRTSAALRRVVAAVANGARPRLRRALAEMPQIDHTRQSSRRALAEMTLAQLSAIERADYAVLERPRAATPLRKLWIAWKYRM